MQLKKKKQPYVHHFPESLNNNAWFLANPFWASLFLLASDQRPELLNDAVQLRTHLASNKWTLNLAYRDSNMWLDEAWWVRSYRQEGMNLSHISRSPELRKSCLKDDILFQTAYGKPALVPHWTSFFHVLWQSGSFCVEGWSLSTTVSCFTEGVSYSNEVQGNSQQVNCNSWTRGLLFANKVDLMLQTVSYKCKPCLE